MEEGRPGHPSKAEGLLPQGFLALNAPKKQIRTRTHPSPSSRTTSPSTTPQSPCCPHNFGTSGFEDRFFGQTGHPQSSPLSTVDQFFQQGSGSGVGAPLCPAVPGAGGTARSRGFPAGPAAGSASCRLAASGRDAVVVVAHPARATEPLGAAARGADRGGQALVSVPDRRRRRPFSGRPSRHLSVVRLRGAGGVRQDQGDRPGQAGPVHAGTLPRLRACLREPPAHGRGPRLLLPGLLRRAERHRL